MNVLFGQSCRNGNKKKDWTNKQSDKEILKIIDTLKRSLFPNSLFKGHLNKYKYIQIDRQTEGQTNYPIKPYQIECFRFFRLLI